MSEARERFMAIARQDDDAIDVAEAALWIAKEEYPSLDVSQCLSEFDRLAARLDAERAKKLSIAERVARLNHFLFVDCGFSGNQDDYYDPRNSFLNDVMERRTGIPITLSTVYCEVGRRVGLPLRGVAFPGHFLVKYESDPAIIIDPFYGTTLTHEECEERLQNIYGPKARLDPRLLQAASPREILVRLLSNLKQVWVEKSDSMRALACVDRILLLTPQAPRELRDRGILYQKLECYSAALRDLDAYLRLAPNDDAADAIRALLPDLHRQASQLQ